MNIYTLFYTKYAYLCNNMPYKPVYIQYHCIFIHLCDDIQPKYTNSIFLFLILYIQYTFRIGRNIRAVLYGTGHYIQIVYYAMLLYTVCILLHYILYYGGGGVVWGGLLQYTHVRI